MEHVRWTGDIPSLDEPVLVFAFEGWSDAGEAASTALGWLRERCASEPLAEIDSEEFYDFTATRPHVRLDDGITRSVEWPSVELTWGTECGRDIVALTGQEPQLRWRTFARQVLDVADSLGVGFVMSFGALFTDVPHTADTNIIGNSTDPAIIDRFRLQRSTYEGPTGILGVLHDTLGRAGLPSASLWAPVPAYVPGAPSPKAALALIRRATEILDVGLPTTDLEIASAAYERQVSDVVAEDDEMTEYVERLEQRYAEERATPSTENLVAEVERFLREQS